MRIVFIFILFFSPKLFAGNEMGNGADNFLADFGVAWFVGEKKTIHYCLDADSQFGRDLNQVKSDIQWAWNKWIEYIKVKDVYGGFDSEKTKFPVTIAEQVCNGSEDLRFYLGMQTAEVKNEKQKYQNPSAISYRESYDDKIAWGKGWIWFANSFVVDPTVQFPNWKENSVFRSILLHEIGHVFGNLHVSGTIMDKSLSQNLRGKALKSQWLEKIDHVKELVNSHPISGLTKGLLGGGGYFNPYRAFEWLMGRRPVGEIEASLRPAGDPAFFGREFVLRVNDIQSSAEFIIKTAPSLNEPKYSSDSGVFKRKLAKISVVGFSGGGVRFASLEHPRMGSISSFFEMNMSSAIDGNGPYGIKIMINNTPQPLFEGYPIY